MLQHSNVSRFLSDDSEKPDVSDSVSKFNLAISAASSACAAPLTGVEVAVLDTIDSAPMLAQVEEWSLVNSGTSNLAGLARMADILAEAFGTALQARGATVHRHRPEAVTHCNASGQLETIEHGEHLQISVRPEAPMQLLLTGHMDTVFPADHPFQSLTWLEEGVLNGPGTADMKGGLAVMLAALCAFETAPNATQIGYDVLINSDEESGSHSSTKLIAKLAKGKHAALTYEPALPDGTLAGARPGSGNYALHIVGRAAHAGRNPEEGRNALIAAADLALRLTALKTDGLKVNVGKIDGGGALNVVPDCAVVRVNMRPDSPDMQAEAEAALATLISAVAREHDVTIEAHGGFNRPPKPVDKATERLFALVAECGAALDIPIAARATGGVCDGNNIAACGVPVVDTMGVRGGAIHSADEFMITKSLAERSRLSTLTLLRLSSAFPRP